MSRAHVARLTAGALTGAVTAAAVALAGGVLFGEGGDLGSIVALIGAPLALALIYDESPKRWVYALYALLLVSSFIMVSQQLRGGVDGTMVLAVAVVAVALPIGFDLILSDLGRHLSVDRRLGFGTVVSFATLVLPLGALMLAEAHQRARSEDEVLLSEIAQRIRRGQDSIVVTEVDPSKRAMLANRVAIRTRQKTYQLADAEFQKETREYTVRHDTERRGVRKSDLVTREAEERMRVILKLQGTEAPDDVVLFSHRGPMTILEKQVELTNENDDAS
jgi:hypothetical protein